MKIHEYQGKENMRQFGVPTRAGAACFSVDEAVEAARQLAAMCGWLRRKSMPAPRQGRRRESGALAG